MKGMYRIVHPDDMSDYYLNQWNIILPNDNFTKYPFYSTKRLQFRINAQLQFMKQQMYAP